MRKMDVTSTPNKKTSVASGNKKPVASTPELKSMFVAAALSMGWQLAVVVIVPIVGGFELDQHFHTSPVWEIIGFVVAALGFVVVVRRQLTDLNDLSNLSKRGGGKS
jgi:F0F1-type ATP synthase assembly protein I